jgi:chemotaxis protein histidine kinase CheA
MAHDAKRDALIGRFRAGALVRVRQTALLLAECEQGQATREHVETVGRELHTLKGEARMLGFVALSELVHRAEDHAHAGGPGTPPRPEVCRRLLDALAVVTGFLSGDANEQALDAAARNLGSTAPGQAELASAAPGATDARSEGSAAVPAPALHTDEDEDTPLRAKEVAAPARPAAERWVQVNAGRIDALCEAVFGFASDFRALDSRMRGKSSSRGGPNGPVDSRQIVEEFDRCRAGLEDAIEAAWALRLVPVDPALEELARHGRELASAQNKRVRFLIVAGGVQIERGTLDGLWDPLVHLLRNAIDHGIENAAERGSKGAEASIQLVAEPVGNDVTISITDDGRGMDPDALRQAAVDGRFLASAEASALSDEEALELVFRHGLSTRTSASELSGRGIGLDVVRRAVEGLGGEIHIDSDIGLGTRFSLLVPATVSKERTLVFECGQTLYGLPSRHVNEVVSLADYTVAQVAGGQSIQHEGQALPLRSLSQALGADKGGLEQRALIVSASGRRYAYAAPRLLGDFDLVRRPVDALLGSSGHIGASATLDDGSLVLILSLAGLLRRGDAPSVAAALPRTEVRRKRRVLVVDDSPIVRDLLCELLGSAGLSVSIAPEGRTALQMLELERPDAVLTDLDMPVMDGLALLREIRARWQDLPVVVLSTRGSETDRRQAAALGADAYVVKSQLHETGLLETIWRYAGLSS